MPNNVTDNINIDVVLGDQSATTVSPVFYPHNVAVSIPGIDGKDGPSGPVGGVGPQGAIGPDGSFTPDGPEGAVQFKATPSNTIISGKDNLLSINAKSITDMPVTLKSSSKNLGI